MKSRFIISKKVTLLASALAMLAVSGAGFAGPIVTTWDYTTNAVFTAATYGGGAGADFGTTTTNPDELSWGATGGDFTDTSAAAANSRSALTVGNPTAAGSPTTGGGPATGSVDTFINGAGGTVGAGISMTHWNNIISASFDTLQTGTLLDTLTLTPVAPNPPYDGTWPDVNAPNIVFDFNFVETANSAPCEPNSTSVCDDLFGIFGIPTLDLAFAYNGVNYLASVLVLNADLTASPLSTLSVAECGLLGFGPGCQGFRTLEDDITTVNFAFSINTNVPEPAPLALIGLGLLGLGYRRFKAV